MCTLRSGPPFGGIPGLENPDVQAVSAHGLIPAAHGHTASLESPTSASFSCGIESRCVKDVERAQNEPQLAHYFLDAEHVPSKITNHRLLTSTCVLGTVAQGPQGSGRDVETFLRWRKRDCESCESCFGLTSGRIASFKIPELPARQSATTFGSGSPSVRGAGRHNAHATQRTRRTRGWPRGPSTERSLLDRRNHTRPAKGSEHTHSRGLF